MTTTATAIVERLTRTRDRLARLGAELASRTGRELAGTAVLARQQAARYRVRRARRIRFPQHRLTWGLLDLLDPGGRLPSLRGIDLPPPAQSRARSGRQRSDQRSAADRAPAQAPASAPARDTTRPAPADPGSRGDQGRPQSVAGDRPARRPEQRPVTRATGPRRDARTPPPARTATPSVTLLGERLAAAIAAGPPDGGRWTGRALADQIGCSRSTAWAYLRGHQTRPTRAGRGREPDRARER